MTLVYEIDLGRAGSTRESSFRCSRSVLSIDSFCSQHTEGVLEPAFNARGEQTSPAEARISPRKGQRNVRHETKTHSLPPAGYRTKIDSCDKWVVRIRYGFRVCNLFTVFPLSWHRIGKRDQSTNRYCESMWALARVAHLRPLQSSGW
jgi:hypothetical protein